MVAEVRAVSEITADSAVYRIPKGKPSLLFTASEAFSSLTFEPPPAAALLKATLVSHRNRKQNSSLSMSRKCNRIWLIPETHPLTLDGRRMGDIYQFTSAIYSKLLKAYSEASEKTALKPCIYSESREKQHTLLIALSCLKILCE